MMKFKFLVFISLWVTVAFADVPIETIDKVLRAPEEVNKILSSTAKDCVERNSCDDLYGATCFNPDGTQKDELKLDQVLDEKIEKIRLAAIKAMGQETLEKSFKEFLIKNGFSLKDDSNEKIKEILKTPHLQNISDVFSNVPNCRALDDENDSAKLAPLTAEEYTKRGDISQAQSSLESANRNLQYAQTSLERTRGTSQESSSLAQVNKAKEEIEKSQLNLTQKKKDLEATLQKIDQFQIEAAKTAQTKLDELNKTSQMLFRKSPELFLTEYHTLCQSSQEKLLAKKKSVDEEIKAYGNPEDTYRFMVTNPELNKLDFKSACETNRIYNMRQSLVELQRITDPAKVEIILQSIIDKNFESYLKMINFDSNQYYFGRDSYYNRLPLDSELKLKNLKMMRGSSCFLVTKGNESFYTNLYQDYLGKIARSKPAVEEVIAQTYNADQKKAVTRIFEDSKRGFLDLFDEEFATRPELANSPKIEQIRRETNNLSFFWASAPSDQHFKLQDDFPLPLLDESTFPLTDNFFRGFSDPSLSFIKVLNASYSPQASTGVIKEDEKMNLLPAVNVLAELDPYGLMMVIAHEVGHKIGPQVGKLNGHDVSNSYQGLLECLKSNDSISMKPNQADETMADWISSKILGKHIAKLPPGERKAAALKVGNFFCEANRDGFFGSINKARDPHPESTLRINGIFGANSDIRNALGCNEAGPFKECKMDNTK